MPPTHDRDEGMREWKREPPIGHVSLHRRKLITNPNCGLRTRLARVGNEGTRYKVSEENEALLRLGYGKQVLRVICNKENREKKTMSDLLQVVWLRFDI